MKHNNQQLYNYLKNIHKNSFENLFFFVSFFAVFQKLPSQTLYKKIKYFKDYGRDIRSQNMKHKFS